MLTKRIIPCLDIKDGRTVKGVNFLGLKDAGDPVELAKKYSKGGADELVFLDIAATIENRGTLLDMVEKVAKNVNIPFTVGGGISSLNDVQMILNAGADKVSINSAAIKNPDLINTIADKYGTQCVVVAIDAKQLDNDWKVFVGGGTIETDLELFSWAKEVEQRGAGEILFTSMNHDGTKKGFANSALKVISNTVNIPVIASGGAGEIKDFIEAFQLGEVDAVLAASVFHYNEIAISDLKEALSQNQINIRPWN